MGRKSFLSSGSIAAARLFLKRRRIAAPSESLMGRLKNTTSHRKSLACIVAIFHAVSDMPGALRVGGVGRNATSAHLVTLAPVCSLPLRLPVNSEERHTQAPFDRFAWQYSFYAYLIYRQAPASEEQLSDLAQALHVMKGHLNPIAVADAVMLTWPFEVTD